MKKSFLFYFIFFYLFSCVSGNSKKKEMDPYVEDSLLSIEKSSKKENKKKRPKKKVFLKPSQVIKKYCQFFEGELSKIIVELSSFYPKRTPSYGIYKEIMKLKRAACERLSEKEMVLLLKPLKNIQREKIALVLPLSGRMSERGKFFLEGIRIFLKEEDKKFEDYFVLFDTESSLHQSQKIYAKIFLEGQYSLILGGVEKEEAQFLKKIAVTLRLPVLAFERRNNEAEKSPYFFQILPQVAFQAEILAKKAHEKGLSRVVLFRPIDGHADALLQSLSEELLKRKIEVEKTISYNSGDYKSMSAAADSLLLLGEKSLENKKNHVGEDDLEQDELVKVIPGKFSFEEDSDEALSDFLIDGVFIPDDFRILKHFVKIFEFHRIPQVTLFGNEQWRSENLITLWEDYWDGAFFVDFMGSLKEEPLAITGKEIQSTLGKAEEITEIEGKRIGYYAAKIAFSPFENKQIRYSQELVKAFKTLKNVQWPYFVFSLKNKEVEVFTSHL
jgi:hypothetical protein